ncbi:hypothetical protein BDN67DRAFT_875814, partial [Paxillus ammoniavirescens]
ATYQALINHLFGQYIGCWMDVYLNDIIIYSDLSADHIKHLNDLCRGFISAVGHLADNIFKVRIPLGVLSEVMGDTVPFQWEPMQQHAFEAAKVYTTTCAPHSVVSLQYGPSVDHVWMMTDSSAAGVGGVVAQGVDWQSVKIAAFYPAKMSVVQHNYPVLKVLL